MKHSIRYICLTFLCIFFIPSPAQITLDYCLAKSEENYPLIHKYGIVEKMSALELSDINKTWLPNASVYAQGSLQNAVPAFPDALQEMISQLGQSMQGMGKAQYKIGVDVNQTLWDGGMSRAHRKTARAQQAEQQAALDVEMYAVRDRVENLFFGILLIDEQIRQTQSTIGLLDSNLEQMQALFRHGTAMQSDVDMVEAQKLTVKQQLASAKGNAQRLRQMLGIFIGESADSAVLVKPDGAMPENLTSDRPELHLFDARKQSNNLRLAAVNASLMPRFGVFVSAYYGYPGFDYFSAMRSRDLSFNVMAGLKVSWNISSLYHRKNDTSRIYLSNSNVDADRDRFLFESRLATTSQLDEIATMREITAEDDRISRLRANVRIAAESQLKNGVIDATALLAKINDENQAKLAAAYHETELLRRIYQLKNTLNR